MDVAESGRPLTGEARHVESVPRSTKGEENGLSKQDDGDTRVIANEVELSERAAGLLDAYRHGTDDAPYFVAREIARLPAPYAIAVTAAICQKLDEFERPRFTKLLLTVATGEYRSVFDRTSE